MSEQPGEAPGPSASLARPRPFAVAITALLGCLAVLVAVVALDRVFGFGLFPGELDRQLRAAARAVVPLPADTASSDYFRAMTTDGRELALPAAKYDRVQAVSLAVLLDERRIACEQAIASLLAADHLGMSEKEGLEARAAVEELWRWGAEELGGYLTMEPTRARLCLAALGWPWLGDGTDHVTPADLERMFPAQPGVLAGLSGAEWREVVAIASQPVPWPAAQEALGRAFGLDEKQARTAQSYVMRRDLARAFHSPAALRLARDDLARLAALAPAQERTVLAMAGATQLVNTGPFALPTLIDLLEKSPELGAPLLRACVRRCAVRQQAVRAVAQLAGGSATQAERVLAALGPFAVEALRGVDRSIEEGLSDRARALLAELERTWPASDSALEVLGDDPARWRAWYRRARDVL